MLFDKNLNQLIINKESYIRVPNNMISSEIWTK